MTGTGSGPEQANRVEALANSLEREDRVGELEGELRKLDPGSLTATEKETWWHFYGITAFHDGREPEALDRFEEAHRRFPQSAPIRFSLGQQCIRTGKADRGFELFRSARFPSVSREYAFTEARYAYLFSRWQDGYFFLEPFYEIFRENPVLDDHYLLMRGLPFFGTWWDYTAVFAILSGRVAEMEPITAYFARVAREFGYGNLQAEWEAYRDDDPGQLITLRQEALEVTAGSGLPTSYTDHARISLATAQARTAATIDDARRLLDAVTVGGERLAWYQDVRNLALAEAAHCFGDAEEEQARTDAFLQRQPMLLQPDVALRFHLLRYQEHLKPRVLARWAAAD
jgi:tetratricopeptide (TPR) repeat protein